MAGIKQAEACNSKTEACKIRSGVCRQEENKKAGSRNHLRVT